MIPASFDYVRAQSVEDAIRLLKESDGEGKLLAGGHSLIPLMKFRLTTPGMLIDISRIKELQDVQLEKNKLIIGSLMTHKQVIGDPLVNKHLPVLAETVKVIGDMQVRNKGTVGGNIAHADPAADLPATALALDAEVYLQGEDGEEIIPVQEFFLGPLLTALSETSVVKAVSFAIPPNHTRSVYLKYAHPASGYAVVGVCAVAGKKEDGTIDYLRIGITGAGDIAYRAKSVEQQLMGKIANEETIREAAALAANEAELSQDLFASTEYRRHLCSVYTERALKQILL